MNTNTIVEDVAISLINFERATHSLRPIKIKTMKSDHRNQWEDYMLKASVAVGVVMDNLKRIAK